MGIPHINKKVEPRGRAGYQTNLWSEAISKKIPHYETDHQKIFKYESSGSWLMEKCFEQNK
jgi:hypothetical protein